MNLVDSLKAFALPERRLFPCDYPSLTKASAEAFDREHGKLNVVEKLAAAREIYRHAKAQGIDVSDRSVTKIAGDRLSPFFRTFMGQRKEAVAWSADAMREIGVLSSVAAKIDTETSGQHRMVLLDKLAHEISRFDEKWDIENMWYERGLADPAWTVFARVLDRDDPIPSEKTASVISRDEFDRIDKAAAARSLTQDAMDAATSFEAFQSADPSAQQLLAMFVR
jgi:hypothetical protein